MYKVCLLPLFILVLAVTPLLAQEPAQPARIELDLDFYKTNVEVMATPDSSLLVLTRTEGNWSTPPTYEFTKYNPQLQSVWSKKVELYQLSKYMNHYYTSPFTYVALSGETDDDFQFVKLDMNTGAVTKHEYNISTIDSIYVFKVIGDNYFMVCRSKKDSTPILLHLNEQSGEVKPLPATYGAESSFSDILAHAPQQQLSVVMSESNGRVSRIQTKFFDADGKLLKNYFIHARSDKRPLAAEITPGNTESGLLIGNYANRNLRYATGFFTAPVSAEPDDMRYYSFLQLKNFFRYMKPKREERTREREKTRLELGKEPGIQYRVLLHDIYPTNNGYILSAEIYFSESQNGGFTRTYGSNGYLNHNVKTYRRTQAIALGFDKNGILLWDNSFPLKDMESYELKPTVEVAYDPKGKVVIAYPDDDEIHYKIMNEDTYIDKETELKLLPKNTDDKILSTSVSGVISWYNLNFAAFGWHQVKSSSSGSRTVFYINKVSF
ncbi:hypothetical protein H8S95_07565 [Pontibacter sp. KCTC 32443]|uniref:hypothetical protein n=1 Tax=Pontibacter TaxID=323449 RepID=UPI00164D7ECA|nr:MULTISPECIES: hypothetical protein [Pontibacter]MBC5773917.1 hypothetical protein [Pontibacter sp. KCTC 32443]